MKKISKIVSAFALSMALCLGASTVAFAAGGSVTFKDYDEVFVFADGSEFTETDLFGGFKNVMPGDTLRQAVEVKNGHSEKVNIYLRAVVHDEDGNPLTFVEPEDEAANVDGASSAADETVASMQEFLSQMSMTVSWDGSVIYEASPDKAGALAQNVLLGEFAPNESRELIVELEVPIEMGNEFMNRVGEVDWVFVVEELDKPLPETGGNDSGKDSLSQTGDDLPVVLIGVIAMAAVGVAVVALIAQRSRKQR